MGVNVKSGEATEAPLSKAEVKAAPEVVAALAEANNVPEDTGPVFSTDTGLKASVQIGTGEYQLTYLVAEAAKDAKLTKAAWNKLTRPERKDLVEATIARLTAEEEKVSTATGAGDTTAAAVDVRVHADRGVGGSYVALGGGERVRVAEASTDVGLEIQPDPEQAS